MEKTVKVLKLIFIPILILSILASVISIILYGYIYFFKPSKDVSYTYKVGTLKGVEDKDLKFIFNMRYFRNKDNSGVECFEIRNNSFIDESQIDAEQKEIIGTGIQFVNPYFEIFDDSSVTFNYTDETTDKYKNQGRIVRSFVYAPQYYLYTTFANDTVLTESNNFMTKKELLKYIEDTGSWENEEVQAYCQGLISNLTLYQNHRLKVNLDDDLFEIKFKNEFQFTSREHHLFGINDKVYGFQQTFMNLCLKLYTALENHKEGEDQVVLMELSDYFDFLMYDEESKTYKMMTEVQQEQLTKIKKYVNSYFAIKLDVYNYGLTKADESLFKCVKGLSSYNTSKNTNSSDYFVGQTRVVLTEKNFEFKLIDIQDKSKGYYITLKNDIKEYYSKIKDIILDIEINMSNLERYSIKTFEIDKSKLNLGDLRVFKFVKYKLDADGNIQTLEVVNV